MTKVAVTAFSPAFPRCPWLVYLEYLSSIRYLIKSQLTSLLLLLIEIEMESLLRKPIYMRSYDHSVSWVLIMSSLRFSLKLSSWPCLCLHRDIVLINTAKWPSDTDFVLDFLKMFPPFERFCNRHLFNYAPSLRDLSYFFSLHHMRYLISDPHSASKIVA